MKSLKTLATSVAAVLIFTLRAAYADMANGSYTNDFSGLVPLWDISGTYSGDVGLGVGLDFSITEASSGKFSGTGTFNYGGSATTLEGTITVSGTIENADTAPRVAMDMSLSGSGTVDSENVDFAATVTVDFDIDGADGELVVTSGSAHVTVDDLTKRKKGSRTERLGKGAELPLPFTATGGWTLTLNLTPNGTQYTGTATLGTSAGATDVFTVTGSYDTKTDTSELTLKGAGGSLSLVISTSGSAVTVKSAKGKALGQALNFKAP